MPFARPTLADLVTRIRGDLRGRLEIVGVVASADGRRLAREHASGTADDPQAVGGALAEALMPAACALLGSPQRGA